MDRREFVLKGLGVVAGAGVAGGVLSCGGDNGGMGLNGDGNGDGNGNGGGGNGGGEFDGTINLTSDLTFSPSEVTIQVGDTVTWNNASNTFHTITPGTGPGDDSPHDEWERQELASSGETFEHTFNNAGTFEFYCEPHFSAGMVGTITVESM